MTELTPALREAMRRISEQLRTGDFRAAQSQLEGIVAEHPDFVEALRLLGGTHQALGDTAAAEALLRRALSLDPNWTPTLATLGELLLGVGRGAEAEPLLQRAASGSPPFPRAAFLLARFYNDSGRPQRALEVATPLCTAGTAEVELAAQHVAALVALGRGGEAVASYRSILAANPNNLPAAHALALALAATGQYPQAEQIAQRALSRGYKPGALYHLYARCLIAQGARERAEAALRECVRLEPRLAEAHGHLAQLIWLRTGEVSEATAELDQALKSFANDEALWATKAALLQGAGDARAGYASLERWAQRPQAAPNLLVRAGLAALEFDPAIALTLGERARRLAPESSAAQSLLAAAHLGVGDARGALRYCEALRDQNPDDQYLIALQTSAWRMLGDERYSQLCDYPQLVLPQQLEAPPQWPDLESFLADVRVSLNRLHDPNGHALLFQSLRHGTETTQDLSRSDDPAIQSLFAAFAAPIRRYIEHIGHGTDVLRRRNHGRWRFNGSWSVRLRSAGFHANHVHPRGWISSACYIELPTSMADTGSDEGILTFGQPSIATNPPLGPEYSVRPRAGMLVLFPSYFWHGTVPFHSSEPRLTVAFDAIPNPA